MRGRGAPDGGGRAGEALRRDSDIQEEERQTAAERDGDTKTKDKLKGDALHLFRSEFRTKKIRFWVLRPSALWLLTMRGEALTVQIIEVPRLQLGGWID